MTLWASLFHPVPLSGPICCRPAYKHFSYDTIALISQLTNTAEWYLALCPLFRALRPVSPLDILSHSWLPVRHKVRLCPDSNQSHPMISSQIRYPKLSYHEDIAIINLHCYYMADAYVAMNKHRAKCYSALLTHMFHATSFIANRTYPDFCASTY